MIEPLIVRRAAAEAESGLRYELIAGERRLRAARNAALTAVPVMVREVDDRAALEMSLVENLAREELNAIEEARAFVQLGNEFALSHERDRGPNRQEPPLRQQYLSACSTCQPPVIEMMTSELTRLVRRARCYRWPAGGTD